MLYAFLCYNNEAAVCSWTKEQDDAVMADFKNRLPDGRLHVIGHARHGMPVSHAKVCAALLRGFLVEQG